MNNNIDIYTLRILAKKILKNEFMFFNVLNNTQVPIDICIINCECPVSLENKIAEMLLLEGEKLQNLVDNNKPTDKLIDFNENLADLVCSIQPPCTDEVKCIEKIKVVIRDTSEDIICNKKIRLVIKFDIFLLLRLYSGKFTLVVLPQDEGTKFCFGSNVIFPIKFVKADISKILDIDRVNYVFTLTIDIPIKKFEGNITCNVFEDSTLQSKIIIKNILSKFEIFNDKCMCVDTTGTHISIGITGDIIDKIGVEQDILICGNPIDY